MTTESNFWNFKTPGYRVELRRIEEILPPPDGMLPHICEGLDDGTLDYYAIEAVVVRNRHVVGRAHIGGHLQYWDCPPEVA